MKTNGVEEGTVLTIACVGINVEILVNNLNSIFHKGLKRLSTTFCFLGKPIIITYFMSTRINSNK